MTKSLWALGLSLFLIGCAKDQYKIGREDPELEIQKCATLSKKKHYEEAVECLEIFKSRFPQTTQGQEASLRIADTYFLQRQYLLAAESYQGFVEMNPLHPKADYALYRAGLSYLQEAPKALDRDQKYLIEAKETLQKGLRISYQGPYQELIIQALQSIEQRLAKRIFYIGRFYYRTGEYRSATGRFQELLEKYSNSPLAPQALYYLVRSQLALGEQENARVALQDLVQHFPENAWTKRAQKHYLNKIKS